MKVIFHLLNFPITKTKKLNFVVGEDSTQS